MVGADGAISVPYAGRVPVAGRTPFQVQQTIERRLAEQLIQPQAIVSVTKAVSNSVTVLGEQATAARVPLSGGDDRLLDVITTAGGSKAPFYETSIRLSRDGQTATIPMTVLVSDPEENILVSGRHHHAGADTGKVFGLRGDFHKHAGAIRADQLDLAQAIAKAGGSLTCAPIRRGFSCSDLSHGRWSTRSECISS